MALAAVRAASSPKVRDAHVAKSTSTGASRPRPSNIMRRNYAFIGSEGDLISRGAVPAGWLSPRKARILLWALLTLDTDTTKIADEFAYRGGIRAHPAPR